MLTSAYDARGNRTSLAVEIDSTDDFLNTYTFDALHRLTRVDQTGQAGGNTVAEKRVDFTYNALGQFTSIARYKDTAGGSAHEVATSEYVDDTLARLTDLAHQRGGTDLFTPYEWSYDNMNRITQFVSQDGTSDYEYDKTSQLTAADHSYMADESYSYDASGNRTMTGYSTGDNNQLLSDGTYNYTYDDEGNRLTRTNISTGAVTEYTWDHRNRLVAVTEKTSGGTVTKRVEYEYDVFDRRISRAVDTSSPFTMTDAAIERYVYDDVTGVASTDRGNVILDFQDPDGGGSAPLELAKRYLYGQAVDQILAQENVAEGISDADRVYWPLVDHLGTVRDLAQQDGTIAEHYEYDSFGQVLAGDANLTRYLFTGREYDGDSGLQYSRSRWYDFAAARWISDDPLGFSAGDSNLARYVGNTPTLRTDPSGLAPPGAMRDILRDLGTDPAFAPIVEMHQAHVHRGQAIAADGQRLMLDIAGVGMVVDAAEAVSGTDVIDANRRKLTTSERAMAGFWALFGAVTPGDDAAKGAVRQGVRRASKASGDAEDLLRHGVRVAVAPRGVAKSPLVQRILAKLDLYPKVIDPRTERHIGFPSGITGRVPKPQRVPWMMQNRADFIAEWHRRGYATPRGGWEKYDILHIQPREFGGSNDFWNLVPVERGTHQNLFNEFWREFTEL